MSSLAYATVPTHSRSLPTDAADTSMRLLKSTYYCVAIELPIGIPYKQKKVRNAENETVVGILLRRWYDTDDRVDRLRGLEERLPTDWEGHFMAFQPGEKQTIPEHTKDNLREKKTASVVPQFETMDWQQAWLVSQGKKSTNEGHLKCEHRTIARNLEGVVPVVVSSSYRSLFWMR